MKKQLLVTLIKDNIKGRNMQCPGVEHHTNPISNKTHSLATTNAQANFYVNSNQMSECKTSKSSLTEPKRTAVECLNHEQISKFVKKTLANFKKNKKRKNIANKYVCNSSTNKYILATYKKVDKSLASEQKKKFNQKVKNWYQIEMNKTSEKHELLPLNKKLI